MMTLIRIFVLDVIVGLNLNVVTLLAPIVLPDQKNLYLTSRVLQLTKHVTQKDTKGDSGEKDSYIGSYFPVSMWMC